MPFSPRVLIHSLPLPPPSFSYVTFCSVKMQMKCLVAHMGQSYERKPTYILIVCAWVACLCLCLCECVSVCELVSARCACVCCMCKSGLPDSKVAMVRLEERTCCRCRCCCWQLKGRRRKGRGGVSVSSL